MKYRAIIFSLVIFPLTTSFAKDLGVYAQSYPIAEESLLVAIQREVQEKVNSGDMKRLQEEARQRARDRFMNPTPVAGITTATKDMVSFYDPTIIFPESIRDATGRILIPAGTKSNPLDLIKYSKKMVFFDGRDKRQVEMVRQMVVNAPRGYVKPVLTAGSFVELLKAWKTQVYLDQYGYLTKKLGIRQVPAIVSQEGNKLRIDIKGMGS